MVCIRSRILLGLVLGVFLLGCDKTTSPIEKSYGDSLVIVTYHAPAGINPLTSVSGISSLLTEMLFDGLIRIDENLEARPSLASSWKISDNGLRWTFYLRRGVRFHDGEEFTAEDVKFTLEEIIHSSSIGSFTGDLADIIKVVQIKDRYTVEILLNQSSMSFLYRMEVGILPAHLLKGKVSQEEFGSQPVGTGPFRLNHWNKDEIILEVNQDYFQGRAYLDRILVKIYPDQKLAWAKLMRGEGDLFYPIEPAVYDFLKQVSSLRVYKINDMYYSLILLNNHSELFHDRRVRIALNYAIDKEYLVQDALKGKGSVAAGPLWHGSWAYNPSVRPYPYDPQKALSLLKEAGWRDADGDHILEKDGRKFTFTLFINEGDETKGHAAMYLQQQLWELGILMDIKTFSTASMDFLFQGRFDAIFPEIDSHIYPDFSYNIWHSSQIGKGLNIGRYRSDIVDELLEKGRLSRDADSARPLYYRFQEEIHNDPPGIFLYWADTFMGVHRRFRGAKITPLSLMGFIHEWYVPEKEQKYKR